MYKIKMYVYRHAYIYNIKIKITDIYNHVLHNTIFQDYYN